MAKRDEVVAHADADLGAAIRARRRELGLTLVQIATETGLSHPFLSQIERGRARPSMRSLYLVATALGTTQQALLARADVRDDPGRLGTRSDPHADQGVHAARLLDHGDADVTEMVVVTTEFESFFCHDRRELVYVVSGSVEVELVSERPDGVTIPELHTLSVRESLAYPAGTHHRHRRVSPEPAVVLLVHSGGPCTAEIGTEDFTAT